MMVDDLIGLWEFASASPLRFCEVVAAVWILASACYRIYEYGDFGGRAAEGVMKSAYTDDYSQPTGARYSSSPIKQNIFDISNLPVSCKSPTEETFVVRDIIFMSFALYISRNVNMVLLIVILMFGIGMILLYFGGTGTASIIGVEQPLSYVAAGSLSIMVGVTMLKAISRIHKHPYFSLRSSGFLLLLLG
jgi:hypothetical protein